MLQHYYSNEKWLLDFWILYSHVKSSYGNFILVDPGICYDGKNRTGFIKIWAYNKLKNLLFKLKVGFIFLIVSVNSNFILMGILAFTIEG